MSLEVNVTKRFDGFTLHAAFMAGDTATALLGASGCGKSMTLRCIAGIVGRTRGASCWMAGCCSTALRASTCRPSSAMWVCCSRTTPCSPT